MLERRFSQGLQARVGYTYSQPEEQRRGDAARATTAATAASRTPPTRSRGAERRRHAARAAGGLHLGGARARSRASAGWFLGGWNLAGILRYESGRPLTITMNNDLGGLLFNTQKRPNKTGDGGVADSRATSIRSRTSTSNQDAWTDPGPLQFGNAPERDGDVRGFANYSEDINIFKVFPRRSGEEASGSRCRSATCSTGSSTATPNHELELAGVRHRSSRSATRRGRCSSASGSTSSGQLLTVSSRAGLNALPGGGGPFSHTRLQPTVRSSPRERRMAAPSLACGPLVLSQ